MMSVPRKLAIFYLLLAGLCCLEQVAGQRSILHWRKDLEYRLSSYQNQRRVIESILVPVINSPATFSADHVRFSDLIIPAGSLILDDQVARPTIKIMVNKTQTYVASKSNELYQIQSQLEVIKRQVRNSNRTFIYKGTFNDTSPFNQKRIAPTRVTGVRVFKQFMYGRYINSRETQLRRINFTNVDRVINETYLDNQRIGAFDSKQRIFYEGRKVFWRSVFTKQLLSGCCDRLKPMHTSHMMTRSSYQNISSPVLFTSVDHNQPVVIRNLETNLGLFNRLITHSTIRIAPNLPDIHELLPSFGENYISVNNLIGIRQSDQVELLKTIVFKDLVMVDDGYLRPSAINNKAVIGFVSPPGLLFDLSHENYLLKFPSTRNFTTIQSVSGPVVINSDVNIVSGINATDVNRTPLFERFVAESIVRIDRPTVIKGSLHFNALPLIFSPSGPQSVPILHVDGGLQVNLVNGMNIPRDVLRVPGALPQNATIRIRGPRRFLEQVRILAPVSVRGPVNGLQLPDEVIPLYIPDDMSQSRLSKLWFINGIAAKHVTVQDNQFDEISLQEVHGDAQNLIMRSMYTMRPDGTYLIRAPLRVRNLNLVGNSPNRGLINGFRPQDLTELIGRPVDTILGRKTFSATVNADECLFNEINLLPNWTSHLIRIDRPGTVQNVYTKLAFAQHPIVKPNSVYQDVFTLTSSISVGDFMIEFRPNDDQINYLSNLDFSPEFYNIYQALEKSASNRDEGRYRVLGQVRIVDPTGGMGRVNNIDLHDIVTLDSPFRFADRFVMVGKVDVTGTLSAGRITSNYPLDVMDLEQFAQYRIPITGLRSVIRLGNLVLASTNRASYIQCNMLNGISFNEFVDSIMSLTRPQVISNSLLFRGPVNFDGIVRTESSLNGVREFRRFATGLRNVKYSFEDGLQCNSVIIKV